MMPRSIPRQLRTVDCSATRVAASLNITANPLAWGNERPEVLVLGFSKGRNAIARLRTSGMIRLRMTGNERTRGKFSRMSD
jgi:hypothetical protein